MVRHEATKGGCLPALGRAHVCPDLFHAYQAVASRTDGPWPQSKVEVVARVGEGTAGFCAFLGPGSCISIAEADLSPPPPLLLLLVHVAGQESLRIKGPGHEILVLAGTQKVDCESIAHLQVRMYPVHTVMLMAATLHSTAPRFIVLEPSYHRVLDGYRVSIFSHPRS